MKLPEVGLKIGRQRKKRGTNQDAGLEEGPQREEVKWKAIEEGLNEEQAAEKGGREDGS